MKQLRIPFMLAAVLAVPVSFAQESEPAPKQPSSFAGTDSPQALREHVPVLPAVRAKYWNIDPAVGYGMKDFGNGVYALSDNGWQSAFLVTDAGVIVFDAPASYGKHIPEAVAKVTNKPIKILVYSHIHKDHIGGSVAFRNIPGLQIIALDTVSDFLKEMNDPNRLIPTEAFKTSKTIKLGGKTVQLTRHNYHSNEGDLFIYVPDAKFLMAVDSVTSGYVPALASISGRTTSAGAVARRAFDRNARGTSPCTEGVGVDLSSAICLLSLSHQGRTSRLVQI